MAEASFFGGIFAPRRHVKLALPVSRASSRNSQSGDNRAAKWAVEVDLRTGFRQAQSGTIPVSVRFPAHGRCSMERAPRGTRNMRIFLGVILGVILTIGGAYLYDTSRSEPSKATAQTSAQISIEQRPMVNWEVVDRNWQSLSVGVRNSWNKLAAR
jgi:hypothetical protein